jgi:Transcriptional regulators
MNENRPPLTKLVNMLYRYTQSHIDKALERFELTAGTYPYLLNLYKKEGSSQNTISKELQVDKAMSARSVKRLEELGYITKVQDNEDNRAYKLYLTDKAKEIVPEIIKEIDNWIGIITEDLDEEEKEMGIYFLGKALSNAKRHINTE